MVDECTDVPVAARSRKLPLFGLDRGDQLGDAGDRGAVQSDGPVRMGARVDQRRRGTHFAYSLAPNQSMVTTCSSPTTQASWPEGREVTAPGSASNSVPSSIWMRKVPATWYWKCGASHSSVPAIGLT